MRFQKLPRLPLALRWIFAHFWPNEFWSLERPCSIQWIFGGRRSMAGTAREMLLADVAALLPELTITLCSVCCYYWALSRKKTTHELRREYSNVKIQYTLLRIEILNFEVILNLILCCAFQQSKTCENGYVSWKFEQYCDWNPEQFGLPSMWRPCEARKTAVVSMYEPSPNLSRLQREGRRVFLWWTDFFGTLQDYRTIIKCWRLGVQLHQYEKWLQRSLCWECFRRTRIRVYLPIGSLSIWYISWRLWNESYFS